jgi:hypothetical protein
MLHSSQSSVSCDFLEHLSVLPHYKDFCRFVPDWLSKNLAVRSADLVRVFLCCSCEACIAAGVPACTAPWDAQLPDGVWHEYQEVLQRWPGAAAHVEGEFTEYLKLDGVDAGEPLAQPLSELEEGAKQ